MMLAQQSCTACRRLKRRCSKKLPSCSLCSRVGRRCEYPSQFPVQQTHGSRSNPIFEGTVSAVTPVAQQITPLSSSISTPVTQPVPASTRAAHYLDSVATRGQTLPSIDLEWDDICSTLEALVPYTAYAIIDKFRASIHTWLPVVSLKRLTRRTSTEETITGAAENALLYAMSLISSPLENGAEEIHRTLTAVLETCSKAGQQSTTLLAAEVLVAYYETAHGMFPTAYYTASRCSRMCYNFGIHDKRKATQLLCKADSWTEVEERRRLWWAIVILDKYIHIGFRFRPLLTGALPPDEIIPALDEDWDRGQIAVNPLLVMSIETELEVGPFARLCQAAHLLGRTCEHVNEHPRAVDVDMHFQQAAQIRRALLALMALISQSTTPENEMQLVSSTALCYSALLLLYDVHSCVEVDEVEACGGNRGLRVELQQMAIDGHREISPLVCELAAKIRQAEPRIISPLILSCLYSAAGVYSWFYRERGADEDLARLNDLRDNLKQLRSHWHAADVYLALLKGTEYNYTGACYQ